MRYEKCAVTVRRSDWTKLVWSVLVASTVHVVWTYVTLCTLCSCNVRKKSLQHFDHVNVTQDRLHEVFENKLK